ncbi:MAG: DUF547 domain-containing protein [Verrucomicrobiae bacterium]|nr:DUF547 domain-containing protein [Verrucomicrobiae bacterium]
MISLLLTLAGPLWAHGFDADHERFARVLAATVTTHGVNYAALKASPAALDAYLDELAALPAAEFAGWPRMERLALLINLYNATTLRVIRDRYPIRSIRSIGLLPGAAWRELDVRFGGQMMSLSHLENRVLRPEYGEPRIHFALVCAARGCPPLRTEPFRGNDLEDQLDDQARTFLAIPFKNRFDARDNTLWLSPIFKWYKTDFTAEGGSLADYVRRYLPADQAEALGRASKVRVRHTDYDWTLNDAGH